MSLSQRGFTLIELLVAMGIAAIVSLMVAGTYQAVTVGGMRADSVVTQQNNARNALALMTQDIKSAGFLLGGTAGMGRCSTLLTYNGTLASSSNSGVTALNPITNTTQGANSTIPGTTTPIPYTSAATTPPDAITAAYNNAFGNGATLGSKGVTVQKATAGTVKSASLFVSDASGFSQNDVDMVVLPTLNACIRLQITNIGGANNLIHNSGKSKMNPPSGFSTFNTLLPRSITQTDLQQAIVQDMGGGSSVDGTVQVTYSIRTVNGSPVLFRTVVNGNGTVMQDSGIAENVVYLRALYAPMNPDGSIGTFVPWSSIVAANQTSSVGAVQYALLLQRPNTGNRHTGVTQVPVLDVQYPADPRFEYQVYTQTVYLRNVAWSKS